MRKDNEIPTIWEIPDELWVQVENVLEELLPPKPTDGKEPIPGQFSMALSSVPGVAVSGTSSPESMEMIVPFIAPSRIG